MNPDILRIFLLAIFFALPGCGGSNNTRDTFTVATSSSSAVPKLAPDDKRIRHETITSVITGISYPLHIYLPQDYDISDRRYPVIYATDGQWIFRSFSRALDSAGKDAILVAIEQGPANRRNIDYLLPGARQYYQFLITELLPAIEQAYRVEPSQRTISGTSYGGVLVGMVLLLDDVATPHFANYLSFDASFYEHPFATAQLHEERYSASQTMSATLVLTSATTIGNDAHVNNFHSSLLNKNYQGLTIHRQRYPVHHNDVADPSFADAIKIIFP